MEQQGFLIGFAQLALVLTGFVSVFVVVTTSEDEKSRVHTHHAVSMITGSFISIVSAFIPIVLYNYGLTDRTLWWWSSLGGLMLGGTNFLTMFSLTRQLTKAEFKEAGYLHMGLSYGIGTASALPLLWNIFVDPIPGNYILAMIMLFVVSVIGFLTFSIQKILHW